MNSDVLTFIVFIVCLGIVVLWINGFKTKTRWWNWVGAILLAMGFGALIQSILTGGLLLGELAEILGRFTGIVIEIVLGIYLILKDSKKKVVKRKLKKK